MEDSRQIDTISIFYTVCPNGNGHVKRSVEIASELMHLQPKLSVSWFVSKSGKDYITNNSSQKLLSASSFYIYDKVGGISLANSNREDFYSNYCKWTNELYEIPDYKTATLSISDNIAAPLKWRPDTILAGSFLWSDILPYNSCNSKVVDCENELLVRHRPIMLNIRNFGMPALEQYTQSVPIPWVTKKLHRANNKSNKILVTCGKSGKDIEYFTKLASSLNQKYNSSVYVDELIHNVDNSLRKFSFSLDGFKDLGLIICRPGIGIITDSVEYEIPILTFKGLNNTELEHNAIMIEKTGIGKAFLKTIGMNELLIEIENLIKPTEARRYILNNLANQLAGGANAAANIILDRI